VSETVLSLLEMLKDYWKRSHLVYGLSVIRMVSRLFEVLNEDQVLSAAKNSSIDFPISLFTGANDFLHILRE